MSLVFSGVTSPRSTNSPVQMHATSLFDILNRSASLATVSRGFLSQPVILTKLESAELPAAAHSSVESEELALESESDISSSGCSTSGCAICADSLVPCYDLLRSSSSTSLDALRSRFPICHEELGLSFDRSL